MQLMRSIVAVAITLLCLACSTANPARSEKSLRAEPATHYSVKGNEPLPNALGSVSVRCIEARDVTYVDGGKSTQCLYVSVDASTLPLVAPKKEDRNAIISYLESISDRNCSTFLARAFAARAGWDTQRSIAKDLLTAVASAVTGTAPKTAANIGLANLGVGSAVDNLNKNYYLDKAFHAMEDAIRAESARVKAQLVQNAERDTTQYPLAAALSDLDEYDDACSIQRGISRLAAISESEKKTEEANVATAQKNATSEQLKQIREAMQRQMLPNASHN